MINASTKFRISYQRFLIAASLLFVFLLSGFFMFRETILHKTLKRFSEKANSKYGFSIQSENLHWAGIRRIHADKITLHQTGNDCEILFEDFRADINPFGYFLNDPVLQSISWKKATGNWDFHSAKALLREGNAREFNLTLWIKKTDFLLRQFPGNISAGNSQLTVESTTGKIELKFNHFELKQGALSTTGFWKMKDDEKQHFQVDGILKPGEIISDLQFSFSGNRDERMAGDFPLIHISNFHIQTEPCKKTQSGIAVRGWIMADQSSWKSLSIHSETFILPGFKTGFSFGVSEKGFFLETENQLAPGIEFSFTATGDSRLDQNFIHFSFPAQSIKKLQSALPNGAFLFFKNSKASGEISLDASLSFSRLKKEVSEFHFLPAGNKLEWENDFYPSKSKAFIPFKRIPREVIASLIVAEDPRFFSHSGIDENGLKTAIQENLNEGRFARGGGTITMQLVRNLYLNQEKNIFRKIEESLIAFVMEKSGKISKEIILETYLNIVEWGPGVYGIQDAAQFYFAKEAHNLNYDEAVFLALLLPNPKKYSSLLNENGSPTEAMLTVMDGLRFNLWEKGLMPDPEFEKEISLTVKPHFLLASTEAGAAFQ